MKKLILILCTLILTSCSTTWHLSTVGHDPNYDTELLVPSDVKIDTLNLFQLRRKLRTDFRFRLDYAEYAMRQPQSFDWNNRILDNRYNFIDLTVDLDITTIGIETKCGLIGHGDTIGTHLIGGHHLDTIDGDTVITDGTIITDGILGIITIIIIEEVT